MSMFDYARLPKSIDIPDQPATYLFSRSAEKYPDNVVISFFGRELTYRQMDKQVKKFMNILRGFGVKKGDAVSIMSPNCPQNLIAYQAVLRLGAIVVQTNPLYVEREIEHQYNDAGVKLVVALNLMAARVERVMDKTPVENVIVIKLQDYMPWPISWLFPLKLMAQKQSPEPVASGRFFQWGDLMPAASDQAEPESVSPDDVALYQYTGGTTGVAKGVVLTHRNIHANALQGRAWFVDAVEGEEIMMLTLPVFHAFGMTVGMNLGYAIAAKLVLVPKFDPDMVMKQIEKNRVTIFPGVPAMYIAINNHPRASKRDLSSVKYCISGAAPLLGETKSKFEELTGGSLVEGYGLSEASPVTHCNPLPGGSKTGSIGMALPSTEHRVVSETGEDLPRGETGELVLRGPQVMRGYLNQPEETAACLKDGWLYTGDMGYVDEDGFVFLMDRKKEMVISGGCNIYPKEVEEELVKIDGVLEAAVIGLPDDRYGERVTACVVLKDGAKVTEGEVIARCKERLASYKTPKQVIFLDSLPKTIIGKVLKRVLKDQIQGKG